MEICTGGRAQGDDVDIVREFFSPITYALARLPAGTGIHAPPR